ncbi:kinase-like protein [Thelephora ganbajun]|uniref:Kinase-like protein n=1 Tax=Thelephora ganbajun TaxID=370292 RepID=A0ACB6Z7Q6_THEGA|nr:kinase-like protein [Thelephora ganbajun]
MSEGTQVPQNSPPIVVEDLVNLGVEPQFIPFIISTILQAEQLSSESPPLTPTEAENLVEILDKVVSSNTVDPGLKNRCFRVLRRVSHACGILPRSYYPGVTLSDIIPYASGGFADIWKGQLDGHQVCVKAFRTQTAANLGRIKRRFYREVIGWKYISHPNVLPFLGVSETLFPLCFVSPWLPNGNIIEYTRKNQRVNRLQLLAQAACGLEYLHSLSVVHGDINPGNILISEGGVAHLGDSGIMVVMVDPTVVEPGSTTTSKPGVVRYMAPELLNPPQFSLSNSNPSKESDVYSLAMTTYETLTEILPYGNARDGIIIFHVVTGDRPPRPTNARWLRDQIWDMITTCWSEKRDQRWDIHAVYHQLSVSSIQETAEGEREVRTTTQRLNATEDVPTPTPPKGMPAGRSSVFVEDSPNHPNPPIQPKVRPERTGPERRPMLSILSSKADPHTQGKRPQKMAMISWVLKPIQAVVSIMRAILRLNKSRKTDGRPSG